MADPGSNLNRYSFESRDEALAYAKAQRRHGVFVHVMSDGRSWGVFEGAKEDESADPLDDVSATSGEKQDIRTRHREEESKARLGPALGGSSRRQRRRGTPRSR